jgi:hypothetical protein
VRFPNREAFLFINEQLGKPEFYERLASTLKETGSSYGRALIGLAARGGVMSAKQFPVAAGLPVERAKGQVPHFFVEQRLIELGLIIRSPSPDGDVVSLWDCSPTNDRRHASEVVEDIALGALKVWLAKVGWTSPKAIAVRSHGHGSLPKFGQFHWDLVGPCYLASLVGYRAGKIVNGFIVGDILLDRDITLEDLRPFLAKWDVLQNQKRATRFQPLFVADWFTPEALHELRTRGCFVGMLTTLFGEEVAKQLHELVGTIQHAAAAVTNNPQAVFDLLSKVAKIEGAALNLRGVVLELIIGHLFRLLGYQIDIRQQVESEDHERAEIDVKATNRREVVCVECKGKGPNALVDAPEIQEWLDKPLVRIKSWLKLASSLPESRRFEFYASTDYTEDAKRLIAQVQAAHKKQPISFLTGADVLNKLKDQKEKALGDIFREQFIGK